MAQATRVLLIKWSVSSFYNFLRKDDLGRFRALSADEFLRIKNKQDLGAFLGAPWNPNLSRFLYAGPMGRHYRTFTIPKRDGSVREIASPNRYLYDLQKRLCEALAHIYRPPSAVHGFVSSRSIITNASVHVGADCLLAVDLENFFPSIHFGRVMGLFRAKPFRFSDEVAAAIAHICCLNGSLPQGAPTSPVISNMIARSLDRRLQLLAKATGCAYTRYADDIIFSGRKSVIAKLAQLNQRAVALSPRLVHEINAAGFSVKEKKNRVLSPGQCMLATGLVVNERLSVRRSRIRRLRSFMYWIERFGYTAADSFYKEMKERGRLPARASSLDTYLRGYLRHMADVRGRYDPLVRKYLHRYNSLAGVGHYFPVAADPTDIATNCFVLEGEAAKCEARRILRFPVQGTAFAISKRLLITCAHCVGNHMEIFLPDDPSRRTRVWLVAKCEGSDVAILRAAEDLPGVGLAFAQGEVKRGDEVTVYGYPRYSLGAGMAAASARISQFYKHFGRLRARVTTPIVAGNSGGPVVDRRGCVVGVAATGADSFGESDNRDYGLVLAGVVRGLITKNAAQLRRADGAFVPP